MINNENGDSLIGVYKRSLRNRHGDVRRGHEVWMFCTGRQDYFGMNLLLRPKENPFSRLSAPTNCFPVRKALKRRFYRSTFHRIEAGSCGPRAKLLGGNHFWKLL